MMRKLGSWVSTSLVVISLVLVGWLLLPPPSSGPWPSSSSQTREAMAEELAQEASRALAQDNQQGAYEAVRVLVDSFPETSFAQRVRPHVGRIQASALRQERAEKWTYTELQSNGWGRVIQAGIASEPDPLRSDLPSSYLVVRSGTHRAHDAVFLIPDVVIEEACHSPSGCLVEVASGPGSVRTSFRIIPENNQEGWWKFLDREGIASAISSPHEVRIFLPGAPLSPLVFESQGLDTVRLPWRAGEADR